MLVLRLRSQAKEARQSFFVVLHGVLDMASRHVLKESIRKGVASYQQTSTIQGREA